MGNCVEIRISVRRYKLWMSYRLYSLYNTLQHTEIMDATHYSFLHIALDVVQTFCILQCVAVCCSVLQCVAACCSVLQCVNCLRVE